MDGERKEISPYIYGINTYNNASSLDDVTTTCMRHGGNRYTGYNWETNYSNAGEDWLNSSDTNLGDDSDGPAYAARDLSAMAQENGISYRMTTLQMAGYVAADKAGTVTKSEIAPSDRWYEVFFRKESDLLDSPDLTDQAVYMDEYVNYLVQNLGDTITETGIQGYALDNEPVLWHASHPMLHSTEVTNSELITKSIELASAVKEIDLNAEVYGPSFWGMLPCITIGEDSDWTAVSAQYNWYIEYYLEQMAQAEEETGTRLLDVLDVHYYA
ncbi:MAG: glycoside hydrolase family 44 protein [Ruminococcus sp.]|nr:glycoside hydrolase family 44 protein [Ruminococcus sp.]